MSEFPKIISVDDHVVEPAHLWQDRLPARMREQGPRVERARWGDFSLDVGASYKQEMTDDGTWGDYWIYEDRLIYVHKRHVAIPLDATPDGDVSRFDRIEDVHRGDDLRRDAARLLRAEGARRRPRARGCRRLARVPDVPALLRADVHGRQRSRARVGVRPRVQRLDDRRLVRRLRRSPDPAVPDPAVGRRSRGGGGRSATRPAARARSASARSRPTSACRASTPATGIRCSRCARRRAPTLCMHIGSSSKMPAASPDAPPSTDIMLSFNNSMASLADFLFSGVLVRFPELKLAYSEGQIGWIPYALERADNVWEFHSSWTKAKETIPEPPSTYYRGRIFGCFTNDAHGIDVDRRGRRRQHLLRDRLPAHRHDVAVRARGGRADDRVAHRRAALQGAARQRDPDARSRPRLRPSERVSVGPGAQSVEAEVPGRLGGEAHPRVLGEPVAEPAVHHGLLDERRGAAGVGHVDRAGGVRGRRRAPTIIRETGAIAAFT